VEDTRCLTPFAFCLLPIAIFMTWTPQSWYDDARREGESSRELFRESSESYLTNIAAELGAPGKPELRGMRELIQARWRGARDGAGLDEAQAESYAGGWLFFVREVAAGRGLNWGRAECSMVFFPTSEVGPICAKNWDVNPDAFVMPPYWPMINEHLIFDGVSCNLPCDEQSPELFPVPIDQVVGRYCRSTREAVELLDRYNDFWGPGNRMLIDRDSNVAEIEKTTRRMKVRWKKDGFGFVTGMAQEDPELQAHAKVCREKSLELRGLTRPCADTYYWDAQEPRRKLMAELLEEAKAKPTVDAMRALLQHRSERGKVAGNGDLPGPEGVAQPAEHTARTQIWILREGRAKWWKRDHPRNIPSWQNPQEDVVYENVWTWK
jgi:hypothetical protein